MFALVSGSVLGQLEFWCMPDGRTFLTDSVTLAAVFGVEMSTEEREWTVCALPDHMSLTCPSVPVEMVER